MATATNNFSDKIDQSQSITNPLPSLEDYSNNVENIIQRVNCRFAKNQSNCNTILYYGHDTDRLRLVEFLFGQHIVSKCKWDVHLIRTNLLPNLFDHQQARELIRTTKQMNDLCFLKIYYLENRKSLLDHLSNISASNRKQLLPKAFIIDDIMAYVVDSSSTDQTNNEHRQSTVDTTETTDPEPQRKRFRTNSWNRLEEKFQSLIRIISGSIDTLEYCAQRLQRTTYLIVKIDLHTFYPADPSLQKDLLFKLNRSHFKHKINVDKIPFEMD